MEVVTFVFLTVFPFLTLIRRRSEHLLVDQPEELDQMLGGLSVLVHLHISVKHVDMKTTS